MAAQTIRALLKGQRAPVVTCRPDDSLEFLAKLLTKHRIGAVPVTDGKGGLVGVLSERDIVRAFAQGLDVRARSVRDLMTKDVAVCGPDTTVKDAMRLMAKRHIRHLPVVEGGEVVEMLSLRDVMASRLDEAELEANVMREYAIAASARR